MNKNKLFYLILFVITFIPVSISMMASSNRKPSGQDDPFAGASAPTMLDDSDPYEGASAPSLEQDNDQYQGYPRLSQQDTSDIDSYMRSFLSAQEMTEFKTLSREDQQALAICSIEEIKQVLNERLAKKAIKARKQLKEQAQFDHDTEEIMRRSAQEYEDEQLQQAMENSRHENYAPKKTWFEFLTSWWSC